MRFGSGKRALGGRLTPPRDGEARPGDSSTDRPEGIIPEEQVGWDAEGGHAHDGDAGGAQIDHASLAGVAADQHHAQAHDHSAAADGTSLNPAALILGAHTAHGTLAVANPAAVPSLSGADTVDRPALEAALADLRAQLSAALQALRDTGVLG